MRPRTWREIQIAAVPQIGPQNAVCAECRHLTPEGACPRLGYRDDQHFAFEAWVMDFETKEPRCRCFEAATSPQLSLFEETPA